MSGKSRPSADYSIVRRAVLERLSDAREASASRDNPGAAVHDCETRHNAELHHTTDALEEQIAAAHFDGPEDASLGDVHMISCSSRRETVLGEGHPERIGAVLVHDSDVPRDEREVHLLVDQPRGRGRLRGGDEGNSSYNVVGAVIDVRNRIVE